MNRRESIFAMFLGMCGLRTKIPEKRMIAHENLDADDLPVMYAPDGTRLTQQEVIRKVIDGCLKELARLQEKLDKHDPQNFFLVKRVENPLGWKPVRRIKSTT